MSVTLIICLIAWLTTFFFRLKDVFFVTQSAFQREPSTLSFWPTCYFVHKLLKELFKKKEAMLKSSRRLLNWRHHKLVDRNGIPFSQMMTDTGMLQLLTNPVFFFSNETYESDYPTILFFYTWETKEVSYVQQDMITRPGHLWSPPVFFLWLVLCSL